MKKLKLLIILAVAAGVVTALAKPRHNVIDEIAWVVGDEPIYLSDIEAQIASMKQEGTPIAGDPYCVVPEQMALEKLYMHQAQLDTIEPPEAQVAQQVDRRIKFFIDNLGSRERVEEYFRKPMAQLREQLMDIMRSQYIVQQVQSNLTKNVKVTPNDVKKYYASLPEDSLPMIPQQFEVQVITVNPEIPQQEIDDVKARLRDYADRVNRGETPFSTLAIMYSEDGSAMQGGELGFHNRADFVPEFANVAWNLSDPKKVSRIVETEYGFHIIQLIEKRGDQVNVRHILLRPKASNEAFTEALTRLDSLRSHIDSREMFEEAARLLSADKDSRNNKGIMMNPNTGSTRFELKDLPTEIASRVENMKPGDISEPFIMKDVRANRDVCAIVRLKERSDAHRATLSEDYNLLKEMCTDHESNEIIRRWVEDKIKTTYVRIEDGYRDCDFQYKGWIKEEEKKK